jgi:LmbE family N-acetylglucosaminyl deacetylase
VDLLLAPHDDDETLFAAYACMRYRPFVIVCLRSFVQERVWDPPGATYQERELEAEQALEVLGCRWLQFDNPDDDPDWDELRSDLAAMAQLEMPERIWAPLPEEGGHHHHNQVGEIAEHLFGSRVIFYSTYTHARGRTVTGEVVTGDLSEQSQKRNALSKYRTQIADPRTSMHFSRPDQREYYSVSPRRSAAVS